MPSPQEQYAEVVRSAQEAVVNGVQAWARTTQDLVHKVQEARPGPVGPQQVIDQAAAVADQLLHLQKELAATVDQARSTVRAAARDRAGHTDSLRPLLESVATAVRPYLETAVQLVGTQLDLAREQAEGLAEALRERAEDAVDAARSTAGTVADAAGLHRDAGRARTPAPAPTDHPAEDDVPPVPAVAVGTNPPVVPPEPTTPTTPTDYTGWTKARLQAELDARSLPRSGTVAQLRVRLEAADRR